MENKLMQDVIEKTSSSANEDGFLSQARREARRKFTNPKKNSFDLNPRKRAPRGKSLIIITIGLIALIFLLGVGTFMAGATIIITPHRENLTFDTRVRIKRSSADTDSQTVYKIIDINANEKTSIPSTGVKFVERKAIGKIKVYNKHSREPQKIIQGTRFLSKNGKIFKSSNSFTIPGYTTTGASITPGMIEVAVMASEAGQSYNIEPSDFTLPGLKDTPLAGNIYGKSQKQMIGGYLGEVKTVADANLNEARVKLEIKLKNKLLAKAREKVSTNYIIFPETYAVDYIFNELADDATTTNKNGATKTLELVGKMTIPIFNKLGLANVLAQSELTGLSNQQVDIKDWDTLTVTLDTYENLETSESILLRVSGTADFIWQIETEQLKNALVNMPKTEYSKVFLNYPGIEKAEVKLRPFWVKKFPQNPSNIEVVLTN